MEKHGKDATSQFLSVIRNSNAAQLEDHIALQHPVLEQIGKHFAPGEYFYMINNFQDLRIDYMHPNAENMIPIEADKVDYPEFFSTWHPDDAALLKPREEVGAEFYFNFLPKEERAQYKSCYTVKIIDLKGAYRLFLMQTVALNLTEKGKMTHTMSVYTDVTDLNIPYQTEMHFIGINGRPSYQNIPIGREPDFIISDSNVLSEREAQVLSQFATGYTQKEVAQQLDLSVNTVRSHADNILSKLEVNNQTEAIRVALQRGLIT